MSMAGFATIVRATRFGPLACSCVLSVLVFLVPIMFGAEHDFLDATLTLRLAMVALLLGAAFVLDDSARPLTEALPLSANRAAAIRMAVTLVPITACWALLLWLAPMTVASAAFYPRAGLIVEPYALLAWLWALAIGASGRRGGRSSALAAPALLIFAAGLALLPEAVAIYVPPGAPGYAESRLRWAVLLLVGLTALVAVVSGRLRVRVRPAL
jgi:hypothetical protein